MIRIYTNILFLLILSVSLRAQTIAYHPNSYWHVKSTFPGKPETKYAFHDFAPQYSYPFRFTNGVWNAEEWKLWKKENEFAHKYPLVGHSWQAVIQRNKETFQKHPEYLALVNGKRPGFGKTQKLCVSNKALQSLFMADRLAAFSELKNPSGSISVEPSDGAGFCECDGCKRLGSISNQVFTLANLTAKAIKAIYPNGKVNLYAYYKHAAPPNFDLEPNVHVTVIPDGFQSLYNGDALLSLWATKAKHLTYYEYFAIPQQRGEQPRLRMQNYIRRMKLAQSLGYEGFWFETGLNINTTIALKLFNQLWIYKDATWEQVSENFLRSSFASSYQPMKRLFTRWWFTWMGDEEISLALYDLQQASTLARSADEKERINDLKAYVHYLALYQEWMKDKGNHTLRKELFDYIVNSSNRMIVNAYALYQIFAKQLSKAELERYKVRSKQSWEWAQPLTVASIESNFKKDIDKYGIRESKFAFQEMEDEIKTVVKTKQPLNHWQYSSGKLSDQIFLYAEKEVTIELVNPKDIATQNDNQLYLTVMDNEGKLIMSKYISYSDTKVRIPLPKAGIYNLALTQFFMTDVKINGKFIPILTSTQMEALQKKSKGLKSDKKHSAASDDEGYEQNDRYYYYLTR